MSASRSPTRAPLCASATARLTETVLFPTPPFPEATATTLRMFGRSFSWLGAAARRTFAPQRSSVSCTPIPSRAPRMSRSMTSFNGQAGVVSSIIRLAFEPSRASSFTISRVTMSLPSSGSCTALSACITVASLISAIHPPISWSNLSVRSLGQRPADRAQGGAVTTPPHRTPQRRLTPPPVGHTLCTSSC